MRQYDQTLFAHVVTLNRERETLGDDDSRGRTKKQKVYTVR